MSPNAKQPRAGRADTGGGEDQDSVFAELVDQHFRTTGTTLWVLLVTNAGLSWLFFERYRDPAIAWWGAAAVANCIVRGTIALAYLRNIWRLSPGAWERLVFYPSFPLGITYVVGAWILFRDGDASYNVLFVIWFVTLGSGTIWQLPTPRVIAVVGGMIGGSVVLRLAFEPSVAYQLSAFALGTMTVTTIVLGSRSNKVWRDGLLQARINARLAHKLKLQTEALLENNIDKSRLLSTASHDLRQPLHAASLLARSLKSRLVGRPDVQEHVDNLLSSLASLNDALYSLLDLSQLNEGTRTKLESVQVSQVFTDLLKQFRPCAEAKGLSLRFHSLPSAYILTDRHLFSRLAGNIIENAIKYTSRGGVLVTTRHAAATDQVLIEVRDSGIGIDADQHDRIFEEFYRTSGGGGQTDGRGLGLAIVRRLCQVLDISVSLQSSPGRGSTFRLACRKGAETSAAPGKPSAPADFDAIHHASILVVDDESGILSATQTLLVSHGAAVDVAGTRAEALAHVRRHRSYDLIIVDYKLGTDFGTDLLEDIERTVGHNVRAVVITGDDPGLVVRRTDTPVFQKPLDGADFLRIVGEMLKSRTAFDT